MTDEQMDARLRAAGEAWRAVAAPPIAVEEPTDVHPLTESRDVEPRRRRTGLLASAAIVAAALVAGGSVLIANITGDSNKTTGMESAGLQGTVWRLVGYDDDQLLPNSLATFYISPDGQLIADDTCDLIGGHASVESGRLVVTDPELRYYNCTDSVGEVVFDVDVLTSSPRYSIDADGLTITGAGKTMHLVAAPHLSTPTLDRPTLTGATWKLVKVTDPDGNDHPVRSDATFRIDGGRLTAGDTCVSFSGDAGITGTDLEIKNITGPIADCEQPQAATAEVVHVVFNSQARTLLLGTHLTIGMNGAGTLEYEWVPSDTAATDPDKLVDRAWHLTSVAGDPVTDRVIVNLHADGTVTGSDGCRDFTGAEGQVGQGTLTIRGINPPDIGSDSCNADVATTVDSLLTQRNALWRIEDGTLVINGPGAQAFALVFQLADPSPSPNEPSLTGTPWSLAAAKDADGNDVPIAGNANLTIDADGHLSGNDGCNSMSGDVDIVDQTIEFPNGLAVTEMACTDDAVAATEQQVLAVLGGTVEWNVDGDRLTLVRPGAGTLIYTAGQPPTTSTDPADLNGTTWELTTIESGTGPDGVASSVPDVVRVTIDNTIRLSAGCHQLAGPVSVGEGTLDVGRLGTPATVCTTSTNFPDGVTNVLRGHLTWQISGGRLTITKDGVGALVFAEQPRVTSLVGTSWTFTGLHVDDGNGGSGEATARPIDLLFDDSGGYRLTTGCHSYAGDVAIDGSTVAFSNQRDLGGDDCLDTVAQDLVQFLDGTMTWSVSGTQLSLVQDFTTATFTGPR